MKDERCTFRARLVLTAEDAEERRGRKSGKGGIMNRHQILRGLLSMGIAGLVLLGGNLSVGRPEPGSKETRPHKPDVDFIPSPREVVARMLKLAAVKKGDVVYDLGCGDGRIVVTAAQWYGVRAVGIDIDSRRVEEARANAGHHHVGNLVTIRQADLFMVDLSEADVVTLYLLPELNARLVPQLERLKPGSRIVSHDFGIVGVRPDHVERIQLRDGREHLLYLWVTPLRKIQVP
jgi:SAM-dependent methyltransferase